MKVESGERGESAETGESAEQTYRIGAVARLTGIAPDTLRMWERRYGVVHTRRAADSNRLYGRHDIARLTLIKRLVDRGEAIGTIANLGLEELEHRLALHVSVAPRLGEGARRPRLVVVGETLAVQFAGAERELEGIEVLARHASLAELPILPPEPAPDVLVLEWPTLHEDSLEAVRSALRRSAAREAVVVYAFAPRRVVRQLEQARVRVLRAPIEPSELEHLCGVALAAAPALPETAEDPIAAALRATPPPRLYTPEQLARIAAASPTVECECPHHLVQLVATLGAFEAYSAECENRSPQDAALHGFLHLTTARARALIEQALAELVKAERARLADRLDPG